MLVGFPRRSDGADEVILDGVAFRARDLRADCLPSFTVTGKSRSWNVYADGALRSRISLSQAGVLQGFRPDYPWCGARTAAFLQIADAVPPPMAARLIQTLIQREDTP